MLGDFTSSGIGVLTKKAANKKDFGKLALTYIQEKKYEKKLGRRLDKEHSARPTTWGNLCELYFFEKHLPITSEVLNETRFRHKTLPWSGSPDSVSFNVIEDVKSPYSMKSFCEKSEITTGEQLLDLEPNYYWQLVSNAILIEQVRGTKIDKARLYIFCPTEEELGEIQDLAARTDLIEANKLFWIANAPFDELPHITEKSQYKGVHTIEFDITDEMKAELTNCVTRASKLLTTKTQKPSTNNS
jgi:hypothetical protein